MKTCVLIMWGALLFNSASAQNRYDIVIDEIMADPSPPVGLPNSEWLEIKNTSSTPINLQNWRIGDAGSQSGPLPSFILLPDSFAIVCATGSVSALSAFGNCVAVTSFPSLDNDGDILFIRAASGIIIHSVNYNSIWYKNQLKMGGGWTLEMIDTKTPCAGANNWNASINVNGGTPGRKNSIDAVNNDSDPPTISNAYTTDSVTIIINFNEQIDSLNAAAIANYSISNGLSIVGVSLLPPLFMQAQLKLSQPVLRGIIYTITVNNIRNCVNGIIANNTKVKTGLPSNPLGTEWIINEILFNPAPGVTDYVEFYNNSQKIIDVSKLSIANRNSSGIISSIKAIAPTPYYIFPGEYIVVTEDPVQLALHYFVKDPTRVFTISGMPSFPDDEGDVIALNEQGGITDEIKYKDDWQFKLIADKESVALERIDPAALSQDETNWHSAASTAGYGTPGYKNSQYKQTGIGSASIDVSPKIISPDNDGFDDIGTIQYQMTTNGFIANIVIFDIMGRPVRNLVRNQVLGINGYWRWDGLDDKGMKLPIGPYIIFTEIFNLKGKKLTFKNSIIISGKLK